MSGMMCIFMYTKISYVYDIYVILLSKHICMYVICNIYIEFKIINMSHYYVMRLHNTFGMFI